MYEKIIEEILDLIVEYVHKYGNGPNCLIISLDYYSIILGYMSQLSDEYVECTMLFGLELIVIDSKNFIKVCRRENI